MTIKWYLAVAHRNSVLSSVDHDKRDEDGERIALFRAEKELTEMGCAVYYPRETVSAIRLNRRVKIDRTLLYNYVFVGLPEGMDVEEVDQAKGVYKVLRDMNGDYAEVSVFKVARFQSRELQDEFDRTVRTKSENPLKHGDRVRFTSGNLIGYIGTVVRTLGHRKAVVDLIGGRRTHAPIECLEDV